MKSLYHSNTGRYLIYFKYLTFEKLMNLNIYPHGPHLVN